MELICRVTREQLISIGACPEGLALFDRLRPCVVTSEAELAKIYEAIDEKWRGWLGPIVPSGYGYGYGYGDGDGYGSGSGDGSGDGDGDGDGYGSGSGSGSGAGFGDGSGYGYGYGDGSGYGSGMTAQ